MSINTGCQSVLILALAVWGATNLLGALIRREAPLWRQTRLLAGGFEVLLAAALWLRHLGHTPFALLLGGAGLACGVAWLRILYQASLHNTTM